MERLENGDDKPTRLIYRLGGKLDFTLVSVDDVLHRGINSLVPNPWGAVHVESSSRCNFGSAE